MGDERMEAEAIRNYLRGLGDEDLADGRSDSHLHDLALVARARLRPSGKTRGWLGEVHAVLKRERDRG